MLTLAPARLAHRRRPRLGYRATTFDSRPVGSNRNLVNASDVWYMWLSASNTGKSS